MKHRLPTLSAFAVLLCFLGLAARADNMVSLVVSPSTGAVTLAPHWGIASDVAGFHLMTQDLSLGGGANQFYSIKGTTIPLVGGDPAAFARYAPGSGAAATVASVGGLLQPDSYSALTSADPNVGYGAGNLYFIHHTDTTDYFSVITPGAGAPPMVTDLKPMSRAGGATTPGNPGYVGLAFAAADLGYGPNFFYYLREDLVTGITRFGILDPSQLARSTDKFDLGVGGHNALAYADADVRFGAGQLYYLRLDPVTGFSIFGTINPRSGDAVDVANLGSVFNTLDFVGADVGFGASRFYSTGTVNPNWQSVSFAGIPNQGITGSSFAVAPTASSGLPITLAVDPSSTGAAAITGPVGGVFTVTPTGPGVITLQATQAGQVLPTVVEPNMLQQSFTATGLAILAISAQPTLQRAVVGTTATFSVAAIGTTTFSYQWRKSGVNITGNASATTSTLTLTNVQLADAVSYDVLVTNLSGTIVSVPTFLIVSPILPQITNLPLSAGGTVGTPFNFTVTATGGATFFAASPLPPGLTINSVTGVIAGTFTKAGATFVVLAATNANGTDYATLLITVLLPGVKPEINNTTLTAGGTVSLPFTYTITAAGSPTSFSASPLPPGLSISPSTGVISGTPTTVGKTNVVVGATNASGTFTAKLAITVAALGVAPVITNSPLNVAAAVGVPFIFTITATGAPTTFVGSPLPPGLSLVYATGAITGTPTTVGITTVLLGATNATGTGLSTLTITVTGAGSTPVITTEPTSQTATAGQAAIFTATVAPTPASTFQWQRLPAGTATWENLANGGAYSGVTTDTLTVAVTTAGMSGDQFRAVATSTNGATLSTAVALTVLGGANAFFQFPAAIALDHSGNLFVADASANTIRKITPAGIVSLLAGGVGSAGSADGNGASARFSQPDGVAVDAAGNVYVADTGNALVRKITVAGDVTTLAGSAGSRGNVDASGSGASFNSANGIGIDTAGNLYVADAFNATIRKVTAAGAVTTLAGMPGVRGATDGAGSAAGFNSPNGVAVDAGGNVFVADTYNSTIRKITPAGVVSTLAGLPGVVGFGDGTGSGALFSQPYGVAIDGAGNIIVADTGNSAIRRVSPGGLVTTIAGLSSIAGLRDGAGIDALFNQPRGVAVDAAGVIWVDDAGNGVIRRIAVDGSVTTPELSLSAGSGGSQVTTPTPATPTPPVTTPASGGTSGGGAIAPWFVVLLALAGAGRQRLKVRAIRS